MYHRQLTWNHTLVATFKWYQRFVALSTQPSVPMVHLKGPVPVGLRLVLIIIYFLQLPLERTLKTGPKLILLLLGMANILVCIVLRKDTRLGIIPPPQILRCILPKRIRPMWPIHPPSIGMGLTLVKARRLSLNSRQISLELASLTSPLTLLVARIFAFTRRRMAKNTFPECVHLFTLPKFPAMTLYRLLAQYGPLLRTDPAKLFRTEPFRLEVLTIPVLRKRSPL